jgi:hypothetical protein
LKTVDQLEREYRARRRAAGETLCIIPITLPMATEAWLRREQISRSEYLVGLMRKDRPNRRRAIERAFKAVAV